MKKRNRKRQYIWQSLISLPILILMKLPIQITWMLLAETRTSRTIFQRTSSITFQTLILFRWNSITRWFTLRWLTSKSHPAGFHILLKRRTLLDNNDTCPGVLFQETLNISMRVLGTNRCITFKKNHYGTESVTALQNHRTS